MILKGLLALIVGTVIISLAGIVSAAIVLLAIYQTKITIILFILICGFLLGKNYFKNRRIK